jgi:hypothetical protein
LQPGGSFTQYRKGSDELLDERGGLLSEEKANETPPHRQKRKSTNLIDEDDTVCVEMMRLGGCLALKENSFSQPPRSDSSFSHSHALPNHDILNKPKVSTSTSLGTSATSILSAFDPSRNSLPDSSSSFHQPFPHHRSELKVSFQNQDHDEAPLARLSEYSDDLSSARTVAWDRRTFQSQQHHHHHQDHPDEEQSYVDDDHQEGQGNVSPRDELSEEVTNLIIFFLSLLC